MESAKGTDKSVGDGTGMGGVKGTQAGMTPNSPAGSGSNKTELTMTKDQTSGGTRGS